jgi:hypothetical protein
MPTAATAIDACSERRKKTAGSRAPKAASREVGGRRQSDLRGWRALTRVEQTALLRRQRAREYAPCFYKGSSKLVRNAATAARH